METRKRISPHRVNVANNDKRIVYGISKNSHKIAENFAEHIIIYARSLLPIALVETRYIKEKIFEEIIELPQKVSTLKSKLTNQLKEFLKEDYLKKTVSYEISKDPPYKLKKITVEDFFKKRKIKNKLFKP